MDNLIKPLLNDNKFTLKDSFDFVNKLAKIKDNKLIMIGFDIETLFTNISVDETLEILINRIYINKDDRFHGIKKLDFILKFCNFFILL